ncbi:hypothetical protein [Syntrophomonas curvata]
MEGNQVSLTRMMLNIATPSDQGISFSRGEILQGTVQEVKTDGLVVMLLKGRLIEAATEVMVKSGQQLFLMVDDFRDGKTYLKVLSPERMEKVESASLSANLQTIGIPAREDTVVMARKLLQHNLPVTPHNLSEMAKGINLLDGANQRNLEAVAFALSRNLPVNRPILNALLQFTDPESDLGKLLQTLTRSLDELLRPAAGQLPQQADRLSSAITRSPAMQTAGNNAAEDSVTGRSQIQLPGLQHGESTANRSASVANIPVQPAAAETEGIARPPEPSAPNREMPSAGASQPRAGDGQQQARPEAPAALAVSVPGDTDENPSNSVTRPPAERAGQGAAPERPVNPGMPSTLADGEEGAAGTVNRPVAEKGDSQQAVPGRTFPGLNAETPAPAGGDRSAGILTGLKNEGEAVRAAELLRPLLDLLQMRAGDKPAVTADKIQSLFQSEKELIRGLLLLEDIIKSVNNGSKSPLLTELLTRIEGMEKEISGQRIFNYLSRLPDSNFNYYYFSFPVKVNNEYRLCQLRINREAGKKIIKDQDNIKFIVSLDTANMGMVLFHVNWSRNKALTLQGVVEGEKVMNYLNRNIGQLVTGLGQLGYSVINLGVRVAQKDEQTDKLRPQMEELPVKFRPFSIDVTV